MLLLFLACSTDPCAWAQGSWYQTGATLKGHELPQTRDLVLDITPEIWTYAGQTSSWEGTAQDPECRSLDVQVQGRSVRLAETDEGGLTLLDGPDRSYRFQRTEP